MPIIVIEEPVCSQEQQNKRRGGPEPPLAFLDFGYGREILDLSGTNLKLYPLNRKSKSGILLFPTPPCLCGREFKLKVKNYFFLDTHNILW
jgi:hypothetical protein